MASTCYCVKYPGRCGELEGIDFCDLCPADPFNPKTLKFTFEDSMNEDVSPASYNPNTSWQTVSPTDTQVGGDHYAKNKIQPIDFILANNLGWCEANAVKYLTRWKNKNGLEDLRKAQHYIDLLIERVEKEHG